MITVSTLLGDLPAPTDRLSAHFREKLPCAVCGLTGGEISIYQFGPLRKTRVKALPSVWHVVRPQDTWPFARNFERMVGGVAVCRACADATAIDALSRYPTVSLSDLQRAVSPAPPALPTVESLEDPAEMSWKTFAEYKKLNAFARTMESDFPCMLCEKTGRPLVYHAYQPLRRTLRGSGTYPPVWHPINIYPHQAATISIQRAAGCVILCALCSEAFAEASLDFLLPKAKTVEELTEFYTEHNLRAAAQLDRTTISGTSPEARELYNRAMALMRTEGFTEAYHQAMAAYNEAMQAERTAPAS